MQSYQHFTLEERESLSENLKAGKTQSEIARILNKSRSSISRELKRNKNKNGSYHPWRATVLYICRRKQSHRQFRLADKTAQDFVRNGLEQFWSPEIICERWKMEHPNEPLCHSTVYRSIKNKQIEGITAKTHLRRRGKCKGNNYAKTFRPAHTIHDRPLDVETRTRLGDLEGDTVYGGIAKGCLVTLIDRTSRFLYAALAETREKTTVTKSIGEALGSSKPLSVTFDNVSEFADYKSVEENHNTTVYFADPHSPWQRGSNENINGLLRFFFPKGTDFHAVSQEKLDSVLALINNRPRKCLGWLSPIEFISYKCCT